MVADPVEHPGRRRPGHLSGVGGEPGSGEGAGGGADSFRAISTHFSQAPNSHQDPAVLAAKFERLHEPHIAPVTQFVDDIREQMELDVPYVDPDSGGVGARVVFLLRSPGKATSGQTGLLSVDNTGPTAANLWQAHAESGLPREWALHWNAVPWYSEEKQAGSDDDVNHFLQQLLELLPEIRVLVAVGKDASAAVPVVAGTLAARGVHQLHVPMPGPRATPDDLARLGSVFTAARALAST